MQTINGILTLEHISVPRPGGEIMPGLTLATPVHAHWAVLPSEIKAETRRVDLVRLQSGDVLKIFNTAANGPVLWEGDVDLEYASNVPQGAGQQAVLGMWVHGIQRNLQADDWARMFYEERPAQLIKDGKTIHGHLEAYFETGSEGVIWALCEWDKPGYAGLHMLGKGDHLKVFRHVTDGNAVFDGPVTFVKKNIEATYAGSGYTERFIIRPMEIMPDRLMTYCVQRLPVILCRPA